jgi:antitoxin component of MazEF toxin-antitoxin module
MSVKLGIRKIGNSLGVILPRPLLESWGVGEGDPVEATDKGLRPPRKGDLTPSRLDELKRSIGLAVVRDFTPAQIRAQILANLYRWRKQGAWVSAYDEWREIARRGDDGELFAAMLGRDDTATRLRESMPFVGLLPQSEVRRLHEEASA